MFIFMSFNSSQLPPLLEVVKQFGLLQNKVHSKKLGQNFLFDTNLLHKIVRSAGNFDGVYALEVGPGPGGLTRCLLETNAKHVYAIERDAICIQALQGLKDASNGRLTVIEEDALRLKPLDLIPSDQPIKIVANLPYNVGTEILIQWLKNSKNIQSMTLMFQQEVAERIVAPVNTNHYGRLSILAQYICEATFLFSVPPTAFTPAPKVFSAVVHLVPKSLTEEEQNLIPILEQTTQAAFSQRRKMVRSSLKSLGLKEEALLKALAHCQILETQRPETITVQQFVAFAKYLDAAR